MNAFLVMAWHHSFKCDFGGFGNRGQLYLLVELHEVCQSPNRVCFRMDSPWFVHISESGVVTTCMNCRTVLMRNNSVRAPVSFTYLIHSYKCVISTPFDQSWHIILKLNLKMFNHLFECL